MRTVILADVSWVAPDCDVPVLIIEKEASATVDVVTSVVDFGIITLLANDSTSVEVFPLLRNFTSIMAVIPTVDENALTLQLCMSFCVAANQDSLIIRQRVFSCITNARELGEFRSGPNICCGWTTVNPMVVSCTVVVREAIPPGVRRIPAMAAPAATSRITRTMTAINNSLLLLSTFCVSRSTSSAVGPFCCRWGGGGGGGSGCDGGGGGPPGPTGIGTRYG